MPQTVPSRPTKALSRPHCPLPPEPLCNGPAPWCRKHRAASDVSCTSRGPAPAEVPRHGAGRPPGKEDLLLAKDDCREPYGRRKLSANRSRSSAGKNARDPDKSGAGQKQRQRGAWHAEQRVSTVAFGTASPESNWFTDDPAQQQQGPTARETRSSAATQSARSAPHRPLGFTRSPARQTRGVVQVRSVVWPRRQSALRASCPNA